MDLGLGTWKFLTMLAWGLLCRPYSLVFRILKGIYFLGAHILNAKPRRVSSWAWFGKEVLMEEGVWGISTWTKVDIWHDKWLSKAGLLVDYKTEGLKLVFDVIFLVSKRLKNDVVNGIFPSWIIN